MDLDDKADEDNLIGDYLDHGYSINDFDPILDKIVKGRLNVEDVIKRHRRVRRSVTKRDTIEHVTKIMENIEEELDDLKVTSMIKYRIDISFFTCTEGKRDCFIDRKLKSITRPRQGSRYPQNV
jgi:hypothetical protein